MKKDIEELISRARDLGWNVVTVDNVEYEFQKYSPAGQDFYMIIEGRNFRELLNNIYDYYSNYDISYETYIWLDSTGHGKKGAPYELEDVLKDTKFCKQMILDLYNELEMVIYNK